MVEQVFSQVGPLNQVIMGLNQHTRTPCGFAFVVYVSHAAAKAACAFISGTKLDNRYVRVDLDWGFQEGRQYGRGKTGGQVLFQCLGVALPAGAAAGYRSGFHASPFGAVERARLCMQLRTFGCCLAWRTLLRALASIACASRVCLTATMVRRSATSSESALTLAAPTTR